MRETIIKKGLQNLLLLYFCVNFAITKISSSNLTFSWPAAFSWRSSAWPKEVASLHQFQMYTTTQETKRKKEKKKQEKTWKMLYKILQTFTVEFELREPMLIRWWRKN